MSTHLASRTPYNTTSLSKADVNDIERVAGRSAKITKITEVANHEVAVVGAYAVGTMAQLVATAEDTRRQLTASGYASDMYDDTQTKILQVTGTNIITLANTAQKEIIQQAAGYMR